MDRMMKLSEHFRLHEFASYRKAGRKLEDEELPPEHLHDTLRELAEQLEVLRAELRFPIRINSGWRSEQHNKRVGGAKRSRHLTGEAADVRVDGISPRVVHATILRLISERKMREGGVGIYRTFVHYDIRGHRARWPGPDTNGRSE